MYASVIERISLLCYLSPYFVMERQLWPTGVVETGYWLQRERVCEARVHSHTWN